MKKVRKVSRSAFLSAVALSVGAAASAQVVDKALDNPLFSLKEIGSTHLIAHGEGEGSCGEGKCGEGKCGEGKCGEGKCGEGKCGEGKEATTKAKTAAKDAKKVKRYKKAKDGKFVADKKGKYLRIKTKEGKFKYILDKKLLKKKDGGEGKCGEGKCGAEGKCGEGKCGAEGKCGEGKCGSK